MKADVHWSAGEFDSGHGSMPKPPSAQLFQIHKHDKINRNTSTFYLAWELSSPLKIQSRAPVRHWIYMVGGHGLFKCGPGFFQSRIVPWIQICPSSVKENLDFLNTANSYEIPMESCIQTKLVNISTTLNHGWLILTVILNGFWFRYTGPSRS